MGTRVPESRRLSSLGVLCGQGVSKLPEVGVKAWWCRVRVPRSLSGPQSLRSFPTSAAYRARGRDGLGTISGRAQGEASRESEPPILERGPTALPSSVPARRPAMHSRYAPRRTLTCPAEDGPASSAGFGGLAWAGERWWHQHLAAAVELPGGRLCSPPRVPAAAAASAPRTAPARRPPPPALPGAVPGAPHLGRARRRRRTALSPARGGSAPTWEGSEEGPPPPRLPPPPPPSRLRAPCSLPSSRISPPGTPDPAPGRGGAGRGGKSEESRGGGGARGAQLEPAALVPGAESPLSALLPSSTPALPQKRWATLRLLEAFWSP